MGFVEHEVPASSLQRFSIRKESPFLTNWDPVDSPYLLRYKKTPRPTKKGKTENEIIFVWVRNKNKLDERLLAD